MSDFPTVGSNPTLSASLGTGSARRKNYDMTAKSNAPRGMRRTDVSLAGHQQDNILSPKGTRMCGHEFHRSEMEEE